MLSCSRKGFTSLVGDTTTGRLVHFPLRVQRHKHGERGMVTAELAIGILSATVVAAVLAWAVALAGLQVRCADSAAQIARQTARNDHAAVLRARTDAPNRSTVQVTISESDVMVTVGAELRWGVVGPVAVSGSSRVTKEPGAGTGP